MCVCLCVSEEEGMYVCVCVCVCVSMCLCVCLKGGSAYLNAAKGECNCPRVDIREAEIFTERK